MLLTTPELAVWWWLVFMGLIPGLWHVCKTRLADAQPMLFSLSVWVCSTACVRQRGTDFPAARQLLPWLLIIAIAGLEQRVVQNCSGRAPRCQVSGSRRQAQVSVSAPYLKPGT